MKHRFCRTKKGPIENHSESVKICVHLWLSSAGFLQQFVNQPHSRLHFSTRSKLCYAPLHSPRPIRTCRRAGDVEPVFPRQEIRDHDRGNPGVAFEERFHDRRTKIFFKIELIEVRIEAGENSDLRQIESRLSRRSRRPLKSLFP